MTENRKIVIKGAAEHNLKNLDLSIHRNKITVITGVSGSGKSSLVFDTLLAESQRRFFYTLSNYTRQFLDLGARPKVKSVSGLSPAISLAQNETQPSRKASVATLSELGELLGIVFARFAQKFCPQHDAPTEAQTLESLIERVHQEFHGNTIAICAPIVNQKKGNFKTRLDKFSKRGFMKAYIDGKVRNLSPTPELAKEEKHTIKLIIDVLRVTDKSKNRIARSLQTSFEEAEGYVEVYLASDDGNINIKTCRSYSLQGGCSECGFSWPSLDTRYFSANSLGQCASCRGYGVSDIVEEEEEYITEMEDGIDHLCEDCNGTGLSGDLRAIRIGDAHVLHLHKLSLAELLQVVKNWESLSLLGNNPAFMRVREEILDHLQRIVEVGLGYIQLYRRVRSLSGGESQRLKLAGIMGENLRGVMYILDEPSQGLHPSEIESICQTLRRLCDYGNTVLIVDHDEIVMRYADHIIDLGPTGGVNGGYIMASFAPQAAREFVKQSKTAALLAQSPEKQSYFATGSQKHQFIEITKPRLHNLKMNKVRFPKQALSVVTGVSGAGKSSLVLTLLYENIQKYFAHESRRKKVPFECIEDLTGVDNFDRVWMIDRKPVAKSTVSMPASYLDIFTELRQLYENVPEAQIAGLTARSFSLQVEGGRCEECRGRGEVVLSMRFLADARVLCPSCEGMRYQGAVLGVRYNGLNLAEVLNLTIEEALAHFATHKRIVRRLQPAVELGLGYLKLGQQSASLSGGEAQRLKLVPFLTKTHGESVMLLVDEPTTGLHAADTQLLINAMRKLVDAGSTVIMIEHNMDVVRQADWVVDLGPGAAENGGQVIFEGLPKDLKKISSSITAKYL